jgi:hypothetical protein
MTTAWNGPANSVALRRASVGTELLAGVAVTPTFKLYGEMELNRTRELTSIPSYAGTRFKDYNTPIPGPWMVEGTYYQPLSYEDLAILTRYGVSGGGTGVTDGNPTPGYTYARRPHATRLQDAMTVEGGVPNMPWTAAGAFFPEFTISGDIEDAEAVWKWNSPIKAVSSDFDAVETGAATSGTTTTITKTAAGWTVNAFTGAWVLMTGGTAGNVGQWREIASNTATVLTLVDALPSAVAAADTFSISGTFTLGLTDRTTELVQFPGTILYVDNTTIGTTAITGRFISFSLTFNTGITTLKRFAENTTGFTARPDLGAIEVTGQVVLEFDRLDEQRDFENLTAKKIRILKTGSAINVGPNTFKTAQIDLYRAFFTSAEPGERNSNITRTYGVRGYVDPTEGVPVPFTAKNTLATLP